MVHQSGRVNQADALEARRGSGEWIDPISSIGNAEVDAGVELKVIGHRVSHADARTTTSLWGSSALKVAAAS